MRGQAAVPRRGSGSAETGNIPTARNRIAIAFNRSTARHGGNLEACVLAFLTIAACCGVSMKCSKLNRRLRIIVGKKLIINPLLPNMVFFMRRHCCGCEAKWSGIGRGGRDVSSSTYRE